MGKNNKKSSSSPNKKSKATIAFVNDSSISDLISQAEDAALINEPMKAIELYGHAATQQETGTTSYVSSVLANIREKQGELFTQIGDHLNSKSYYLLSISSTPPNDELLPGRILYLAQMLGGAEALTQFMLATKLLKGLASPTQPQKEMLCSTYCSICELFMTDLCFEKDAETNCEEAMAMAMQLDDGKSPHALQTMASLRLSQCRGGDAIECMQQVWSRIGPSCSQVAATYFDDQTEEEGKTAFEPNLSETENLPSFESRTTTAKLLMVCVAGVACGGGEESKVANNLNNAAVTVLGSLLVENDEVVETFFLIGVAFKTLNQTEEAKTYFNRAKEMLAANKKSLMQVMSESGGFGGDGGELQLELEEIEMRMDSIEEAEEEMEENEMAES